ncbi:MAG: plasmid pRiA4b ORF-3 family protein [Sphaerochaetaceae bacterium]
MQIGCTKKLLDYMGVTPLPSNSTLDSFFSWSASLFTFDRRRTIIVANDFSSYGFVLYGIKKKDLKEIVTLIIEGIRTCFETEGIDPAIADKYLEECGTTIKFTKTPNAKVVARLNHFRQRLYSYIKFSNPATLLQSHLNSDINMRYHRFDEKDEFVSKRFVESLTARYGDNIYSCKMAELEISLELETVCRRRVLVPLNSTFSKLHLIIQILFDWRNRHLYDFWIKWDAQGRPLYILDKEEMEMLNGHYEYDLAYLVTLKEVFSQHNTIIYHYDFGDYWTHTIKLMSIKDHYSKNHPICLEGEGSSPPEDSGGEDNYKRLLEIADDPNDPDYAEVVAWLKEAEKGEFNLNKINKRLSWRWL